jgi:hypothetical protein
MNGEGVMTLADGTVYNGSYQNSKMHGFGFTKNSNGNMHIGEYKNN